MSLAGKARAARSKTDGIAELCGNVL